MQPTSPPERSRWDAKGMMREAAFFILYFLYVWLRINPGLHNQRQDPVFLLDSGFLRDCLLRPSGPAECVSALFTQLFSLPVVGALLVTAAAWLLTRMTCSLIQAIGKGHKPKVAHFLPALLVLMLQSLYTHSFSVTLGALTVVGCILLQVQTGSSVLLRIACFLALGAFSYWAAGAWLLVFGLAASLNEALAHRHRILGLVFLSVTALLPFIAKQAVFVLGARNAYLIGLPFSETYHPRIAPFLFVGFFPVLWLYAGPVAIGRLRLPGAKILKHDWVHFALGTLVLAGLGWCAASVSFNPRMHRLLQVDYDARRERWDAILRVAARDRSDLIQVAHQTNRALFHTGRLLDDMFAYPQIHGTAGLLLPREYGFSAPLQESDFCLDLGSINESRHWAYEALSTAGRTPWILKRCAFVNLAMGDLRAAERCLNMLDRTVFFHAWAVRTRRLAADSALAAKDPAVARARALLPSKDYLSFVGHPPSELDTLIHQHPENRMAFEYRVALDLLDCRLTDLPYHLLRMKTFQVAAIPRHLEEAMIAYWAMLKIRELPAVARLVRPERYQRFREINRVLTDYGGDKQAARAEMERRFGDTFWYYLAYNPTIERLRSQALQERGGLE